MVCQLPALLLLPYYRLDFSKKKSLWQTGKDYWEKFWDRKEPKINLLLCLGYSVLAAGCFFLLFHGQKPVFLWGLAISTLVILKHEGNIRRLLAGAERKLGEKNG